jgi:hypothetical protein
VRLAQIAVGVLGVLLIASKYATGLIRTSMAAVPRRLPVLWGSAIRPAVRSPDRGRLPAGKLVGRRW